MRIISWNVNGIRAVHKKGLFEPFIKKYKPDILCLQETKAEEHESPIDLPDYDEYWNSSKARKGYSGTAIFTKMTPDNVLFSLPEDIEHKYGLDDDPYGNPNLEGRVITADMHDFYVVSVYTPNAKDDLSRIPLRHTKWDPAFLEYMTRLEAEKPVIFCGDLNVAHTPDDLARPKENEGKKGLQRKSVKELILLFQRVSLTPLENSPKVLDIIHGGVRGEAHEKEMWGGALTTSSLQRSLKNIYKKQRYFLR